ncbi:MAG: class I SAM-dependent methyltransferase [Thermomicrobia bacterium]|nr:class I SAM-dependent methyltransferase [Thermomicrobia bacterium]
MSAWRTDEHDAMFASETVLWWYVALREYALDWLRLTETMPRAVLTLLDAGCGTGGMLERLMPYGAAVGIDLAPHAIRIARERRGGVVLQGSVAALPFADETFDAAVSLDVISDAGIAIEAAALDELSRVLRPGGRLLLNLPAFASLAGEHDVAVRTARRYTTKEARALITAHGFVVERCSYWNMTLTPAIWVVRRFSRRKPLDAATAHSDITPPAAPINRTLLGIARLERRLLHRVPRLPFGSSLLILARKERTELRAPMTEGRLAAD